ALIMVLDRSWSMAGTSIDLCKAAAAAALDVMTDEQSLGVLTFNDKFDWDVTLRNVGKNRDSIRAKIAAIEPAGRTLIFPAHELPQIFVKEAKNAATPSFDEKVIKAVVKRPAFLQDVDVSHLPPLHGLTAVVMKDAATEVVATPEDDPILAFWPVGLGRAAVFASDVKDRWGADWVKWRGYGPFFSAVVHALERQRPPALGLEVTADPAHGTTQAVRMA